MAFSKKGLWFKIFFLVLFLLVFWSLSSGDKKTPLGQTPVFFFLKKPAIFFGYLGNWFNEKISFWGSIGELKENNEKLFWENLSLKGQLAELRETKSENEVLRKELDLRQKENVPSQAALIVARRLENGQAALFIDKGEESGIKEGAAVLVNQKFLIGRVKKVFWRGAEVELIFSANFLAGVEIQDQGSPGVIQGVRGTAAVLDKVPSSATVEKGQTLITSGLGGEFPRGFPVGFVGEELESEGGLFRRFSVDFPLELEKIRLVWVMNNF